MIRFQKNKLFQFAAVLLLVGFAVFAFHPLIHATHHAGDKDDADNCPSCQFVATLGFILLCIFLLFFRAQREQFTLSEFRQSLPFKFLSPYYSQAPPVLS